MKKPVIILSLIAVLFFSNSSYAQSNYNYNSSGDENYPPRNSIVTLFPLAFLTGNFKVGFEQRLSEQATIKIIPSVGLADHSNFYNIDSYFGFNVEGMLKYFPMKKSPNGFYASVYAFYKMAQGTTSSSGSNGSVTVTTSSDGSVTAGGGGVCFGGQFNVDNIFFIDMYIGGGPVVSSGKYFFPDHTEVNLFHGNQLTGFANGIGGHAGISFGIPLK